jgi:hypothetical protein
MPRNDPADMSVDERTGRIRISARRRIPAAETPNRLPALDSAGAAEPDKSRSDSRAWLRPLCQGPASRHIR